MTVFNIALKTQIRVVFALMLRETRTLFGKHKFGYLWVVINAVFSIGIFWAIRDLAGLSVLGAFAIALFVALGALAGDLAASWVKRRTGAWPWRRSLRPRRGKPPCGRWNTRSGSRTFTIPRALPWRCPRRTGHEVRHRSPAF